MESMNMVYLILAGVTGYLIGSIPFGYLFVKAATGKNVLEVESGRTGGTNTYRAAGAKVGVLTGLSDILKGAVAVWVALWLWRGGVSADLVPWIMALAGVASVIGHNWSLYIGFRGGAGTTPNIGWAVAVWWPIFPIGIVILLGLFWLTGMASVVSLSIGVLLPLIFGIRYLLGYDPSVAYLVGSLITCALVTWSLRPNIQRILAGNERVVGPAATRRKARQRSA
jgi:glycerol-3-phosphate acyltransferase PlsY